MVKLVNISEAASLALHTAALLARKEDCRMTAQELADVLGGSVHHLSKVMQRLVRAGLVDSAVGPQGGFRLARPAKGIRLLEIYEAIEGPLDESGCLLVREVCDGTECLLGDLIQRLNCEVLQYFRKTRLTALAESIAIGKGAQATGAVRS